MTSPPFSRAAGFSHVEGFCRVEGGRIWFRRYLPAAPSAADAPNGAAPSRSAPLVLLHGGPGATHDYLEPIAEAVAASGREAIVYDQLGGGRSDRPAASAASAASDLLTIRHFVTELDALLAHLCIEEFHLLGQSWGTMLALAWVSAHTARRAPSKPASAAPAPASPSAPTPGALRLLTLTLSGPLVNVDDWMRDQRLWLAELPAPLRDAVRAAEESGDFGAAEYRAAMDEFYARHLCRLAEWPECLTRTFAGLGEAVYLGMWGPSEFTCTGSLLGADLSPALDVLAASRTPVLFTCGEFDEARPDTVARYAARVPGARLSVIAGASHQHHLEKPVEYLAALLPHMMDAS